jgi:hypothetical protein
MTDASTQIETKIKISADAVAQSIGATDDSVAASVVGRDTNAHLLINSSFLYRDKSVKTNQSPRRLLVQMNASGQNVRGGTVRLADNERMTTNYKLITRQIPIGLIALDAAIEQEISSIGDLIFILVGTVKGLRPLSQPIKGDKVKELRLDPSITGNVRKVEDSIYSLRKLLPIDEVFKFIDDDLGEAAKLSADDRIAVRNGCEQLIDNAITEVSVPTAQVQRGETVLGKIVASMRHQTTEYNSALEALRRAPEDQKLLHEILRIAYNFSADVLPLISLLVSVCDLKPLVFWCTLKEQWALRQAFSDLPWASLGRKEKLEDYKTIVSQARSHAFHHVLPFDTTVEVDLSRLDVRAETMRLFVPFGKKEGRGVHLKDQKLADWRNSHARKNDRCHKCFGRRICQ